MRRHVNTGLTAGCGFASVLMMLIILSAGNDLFSRNIQTKVTRQSSLDAFKKGDFESAFRQFGELLMTFTKDPLYKYYSGVCLVQMQKDPESAVTFLTEATKDGAIVRTIPSDALFWLGRAQQMSGRFDDAVRSYNDFTAQSGRRAARELDIPDYIQQCADKKGQLTGVEFTKIISGKETKPTVGQSREITAQMGGKDAGGDAPVNKPDTAHVDRILSEALDFQVKADSVEMIGSGREKNLGTIYQEQADKKFAEAHQASMKNDTALAGRSVPQPAKPDVKPDSAPEKDAAVKPVQESKITVPAIQPEGVLSLFRVESQPVYTSGEKIQMNPAHPPGLIYRIQVGVFRNPVSPSYFKGITPIYGIRKTGSALTNYYAGMFRRLADAKKAVTAVKQKGFKDAFIVAFSGGKVVSSERAALLEKEWSIIPFIADTKYLPDSPVDTIPPALSFRVEIVRVEKPVSEESYEGMKKIAGTGGLDIETLPDGSISYLLGNFITYESAEEYADLLIRNGFRDAKVVAWLGKKEIPVETAKQLFEKLE